LYECCLADYEAQLYEVCAHWTAGTQIIEIRRGRKSLCFHHPKIAAFGRYFEVKELIVSIGNMVAGDRIERRRAAFSGDALCYYGSASTSETLAHTSHTEARKNQ